MSEFKTYEIKLKRGIDDILTTHPWSSASQGDHSFSDNVKDDHDWMIYNFKDIDRTNQEKIDAEIERRLKVNIQYIKKLKLEGRYGQEYIVKMHLKPNPVFDMPVEHQGYPLETHKMIFIDDK